MRLAVIPARGGSKRIPRKNIRTFAGRPMIAWSIDAALKSECFDHVIVSTDDAEIADIARSCGAEIPFVRPSELADDFTGTVAVMAHAVREYRPSGNIAGQACCIYATAPFVQADDLRGGLDLLETGKAAYSCAVTTYAFPIQRAVVMRRDGLVEMRQPEYLETRSQDLEEVWHDAGQFYWGTAEAWLEHRPIFQADTAPLILPRNRVQDIDTMEDWTLAEAMFKAQYQPMIG